MTCADEIFGKRNLALWFGTARHDGGTAWTVRYPADPDNWSSAVHQHTRSSHPVVDIHSLLWINREMRIVESSQLSTRVARIM
jgi:hypothetical protein